MSQRISSRPAAAAATRPNIELQPTVNVNTTNALQTGCVHIDYPMGQVAFDTLQASEELETAGISREQAKAISLIVRKSHEVADVATKADLVEVKHEIAEVNRNVADVRKDIDARFEKNEAQMQARFEKTEAQIADVRKDLSAEIADVRKDLSAEIADVRKDMTAGFDKLGMQMTIRLGLMVAAAVSIIAAILKM